MNKRIFFLAVPVLVLPALLGAGCDNDTVQPVEVPSTVVSVSPSVVPSASLSVSPSVDVVPSASVSVSVSPHD